MVGRFSIQTFVGGPSSLGAQFNFRGAHLYLGFGLGAIHSWLQLLWGLFNHSFFLLGALQVGGPDFFFPGVWVFPLVSFPFSGVSSPTFLTRGGSNFALWGPSPVFWGVYFFDLVRSSLGRVCLWSSLLFWARA